MKKNYVNIGFSVAVFGIVYSYEVNFNIPKLLPEPPKFQRQLTEWMIAIWYQLKYDHLYIKVHSLCCYFFYTTPLTYPIYPKLMSNYNWPMGHHIPPVLISLLKVAPVQLWVPESTKPQLFYSSDIACHLAIWRRGWSQISLQCSPAVSGADVPNTRRPITVLGLRGEPLSESIRSSSTLVSLRPSSEGRSNTKSSLKTGLGEHFFTWVFFLHMRFFPWYMFTLTYGSGENGFKKNSKNCIVKATSKRNIHLAAVD